MTAEPAMFVARSCHRFASDRIYRVDLRDGAIYFLRIGGHLTWIELGSRVETEIAWGRGEEPISDDPSSAAHSLRRPR